MSHIDIGSKVFKEQAEALIRTAGMLDDAFDQAVDTILGTSGRIIISGMGKSGIIGGKIAATLASTGTPSFSVHPAEAYHGDLGMFTAGDVAILISHSGETEEIIRLIPSLTYLGIKTISLVGNKESTLAKNSDVTLDVSVLRETCPNNLAPTTSTTVSLVMGDALAVALMRLRNFQPKDFAVFHPGGSLGRRLLTPVKELVHCNIPYCNPTDNVKEVIRKITDGGLGLSVVLDNSNTVGVITDGDLRRALGKVEDIEKVKAADIMTRSPLTIDESEVFAEAEDLMLREKVTSLLVMHGKDILVGVLKLQDAEKVNKKSFS